MIIDIFIKICKNDYNKLSLLLKSIEKYVTGFRRVIIVMDRTHNVKICKTRKIYKHKKYYMNFIPGVSYNYILDYEFEIRVVTEKKLNYSLQDNNSQDIRKEFIKLQWYNYTNSDAIYFMDYNYCYSKPVNLSDMVVHNQKIWLFSEWETTKRDNFEKTSIDTILKRNNTFNCYILYDFLFFRNDSLCFMNQLCKTYQIDNIKEYMITKWSNISMFNVFGNWCFLNSKRYIFLNIDNDKSLLSNIKSDLGMVKLQKSHRCIK